MSLPRSIRGTTALEDVAPADVVIEAVTENFDVKLDLRQRVDALVRPETIIASNTSSISITKLAAAISHPDRFIGMHFFNPVPVMALVEIVRGLQTTDATHDMAEALALQLGKSPITVKSGPGFLVNRAARGHADHSRRVRRFKIPALPAAQRDGRRGLPQP